MHSNDADIDNTPVTVGVMVVAAVGVIALLKYAGWRFNFGVSGKVGMG